MREERGAQHQRREHEKISEEDKEGKKRKWEQTRRQDESRTDG